jgi:hypothetical protein
MIVKGYVYIYCDTLLRRIRNKCRHFGGVTWLAIKNLDRIKAEVSTEFFH